MDRLEASGLDKHISTGTGGKIYTWDIYREYFSLGLHVQTARCTVVHLTMPRYIKLIVPDSEIVSVQLSFS